MGGQDHRSARNPQARIEGSDREAMTTRSHEVNTAVTARAARIGFVLVALAAAALSLPQWAHAAGRHAAPRATPSIIAVPSEGPREVTGMSFALDAPAQVRATVVRDRKVVRVLRSATMRRGTHRLTWDGSGDGGVTVAPGSYAIVIAIRRSGRRAIVHRSSVQVTAARTTTSVGLSLAWPVVGVVSSPFGPRGTRQHDGIDIPAASGTPIVAAAGGRVVSAGEMQGYGLTVLIEHDAGVRTLYAHQSRLAVSPEQVVAAGEVIGYVGHTGVSDGDHLHFELRGSDGVAIDPLRSLPARAG